MNRSVVVLVLIAVLAAVSSSDAVVTKHYSFQPCQATFGGGASAIVPVPKQIADAHERGRQEQKKRELSIIGTVTEVVDGETIAVTPTGGTRTNVRLNWLQAPKGEESGAASAKNALSGLVNGKKVTVKYQRKDGFGNVYGVVWFGNVNVNKSMVRSGFAKAANKEYADDQRQAKLSKLGIWAASAK